MDTGGSDLIPRFRPPHSFRDLGAVFVRKKVNESILDFENDFALAAGQAHARAFPYGRTALLAVLEYLKQKFGPEKTEVICPSYTCVVVAHAIVEAGLKPVFVDCEEETLNMDWQFVGQAASERTLAVISTSLFGNPVRREYLESFRTRFPNLPIVQDCAHSFFAGNVHKEGLAAIYGMNVSKLISSIFGGMVSTDDKDLADWLSDFQRRRLAPQKSLAKLSRRLYAVGSLIAFSPFFYWATYLLQKKGWLSRFTSYYRPDSIDFPIDAYSQIGVLEAEMGRKTIQKYRGEILRRIRIASIYRGYLSSNSAFTIIDSPDSSTYSHLVLKTYWAGRLERKLAQRFVELGRIVDYDVSSLPAYVESPYFGCGISRGAPELVLNLPIHRGITPRKAERISRALLEVVQDLSRE